MIAYRWICSKDGARGYNSGLKRSRYVGHGTVTFVAPFKKTSPGNRADTPEPSQVRIERFWWMPSGRDRSSEVALANIGGTSNTGPRFLRCIWLLIRQERVGAGYRDHHGRGRKNGNTSWCDLGNIFRGLLP